MISFEQKEEVVAIRLAEVVSDVNRRTTVGIYNCLLMFVGKGNGLAKVGNPKLFCAQLENTKGE